MSTLFISHSSKDNAAAAELKRRLDAQGHHSVFLDLDPERGIVGGQSWERTLYRKLRACRAVVALCTDAYLASQWCFAEIALARMEGKPILALQVDPLSPDARLPAILSDRQFIDLRPDPEQGYARLWRALEALDLVGVRNEWNERESPYLGLNAYDERHAPVFFGRDDETRAGIELLERGAPGLVMVLGASGSGKSSIARAGMVPRLRRAGGRWLIVGPFRPRAHPFAELAEAFVEAFQRDAPDEARSAETRERVRALRAQGSGAEPAPAATEVPPVAWPPADDRLPALLRQLQALRQNPPAGGGPEVLEFLDWSVDDLRRICGEAPAQPPADRPAADAPPAALAALAEHLRHASGRREARVLLVIDQFEELLARGAEAAEADRFLAALRQAVEAEHSSVMALGTMRSDFLGAFQQQPALLGIDFASLSVGPMGIDGMRKAIEEPARLAGTELETGLADLLLKDADTPDALPLLSFTLSVLWRDHHGDGRLETSEYQRLGRLQGTITREADALLDRARRSGQEDALRRAFLLMARLTEEGHYARQPVSWKREEIRQVEATLQEFEKRRLLVTRMEKGQPATVEVVHEALFRSWAPLRSWLDAQRSALLLLAQLRRDAEEWIAAPKTSDTLWQGGRLQQAEELMRKGELDGDDDASKAQRRFILAGVRRRRLVRGALGVTTALVIAVLGVALLRASWATEEALAAKDAALKLAVEASAQRVVGDGGDMLAARRSEGATLGVLAILAGHRLAQTTDSPAAKATAYGALQRVHEGMSSLQLMIAPTERARGDVRFSADGSRLVFLDQSEVRSVDSRSGQAIGETITLALEACVMASFSTGFERVLCQEDRPGAEEFQDRKQALLRLRDARSGQPIGEAHDGHSDYIASSAFSPDGSRIVTTSHDHTLRLWDGRTGAPLGGALKGHEGAVGDAVFTPDGNRIVSGSGDGTVRLWDGRTGAPVGRPMVHGKGGVGSVAAGPELAASGGSDGIVRLWNLVTGEPVVDPMRGHSDSVVALAFSPVGGRLVSGGEDGTLRLWDTRTGKAIGGPMKGHTAEITQIAFSPDGSRFFSTARDSSLLVWDARIGRSADAPLEGYVGQARALAFSPDGGRLISGGEDGTIQRWDARLRKAAGPPLKAHARAVTALAFSPSGDRFLSASEDGTLRLWDAASNRPSGPPIQAHAQPITAAAFSPEGDLIATASEDGTWRLWDTKTQRARGEAVNADEQGVSAIALSGDGTRLVSAGGSGHLQLWDLRTGRAVGESIDTFLEGGLDAVALSRDGQRIAATVGNKIGLWAAADGASIRQPVAHAGTYGLAVGFSVDGAWIVSHDGGSTRLWDGRTGLPVGQPMLMSGGGFIAAAFDPSGQQVAISSGTELRLVPILDVWAETLCAAQPLNLSRAQWRTLVSAEIPYREVCPGKPIPPD